jgi:membrane-bound lytic murein transglycosylase F
MTGKKALPANFFVRQMTVSVKRMLLMTLLFCGAFMIQPSSSYRIDKVTERGTLRVIGVAGPTTFLPHGAEGARGLQYELLRKFAEELHIKLEITQAPNAAAVIKALRSGSADIGITGLASRDLRLKTLLLSQPYLQEQQQLIERSNDSSVSDTPQIAVGKNSIAQQQLALIEPNANLLTMANASPDELLMKLEDGSVDYAVINEAEFEARRAAFPELKTKTDLSEVKLAWAMRPQDQHLLKLANYFLQQSTQDGSLQRLTRFYSQGETFNNIGVKTFQRDMQARLPLYKTKFEQQAQKHSIDWRLLAAIGYQESKWNANAISPTGVSGLMMLTKGTAAEMGI